MIYQNDKNENTQNQFSNALKELKIGKLLRNSNITKSCGISAYEVFQFLLLLVFQERNLFRFLNSKHKDQAVSKNEYSYAAEPPVQFRLSHLSRRSEPL